MKSSTQSRSRSIIGIAAAGIATWSLLSWSVFAETDAQAPASPEPTAKEPEVPLVVPVLEPLDVHPRTSLTVVEQLRHNHYVKKPLDDGISSDVFDKYLDTLDAGRAYFLAGDVEEFEAYRYTLDDALKRGDLMPAYEIFNRYQNRVIDRLQYLHSRGRGRRRRASTSPSTRASRSTARTRPGPRIRWSKTTSGANASRRPCWA